MSTPQPQNTSLETLEEIARPVSAFFGDGSHEVTIAAAANLARAMARMRKALPESELAVLAELQNTPLGFMTDRPDGYAPRELRDVIIEAVIRGYRPCGNEFNVIAGRFYAAKNGLARKLREYPGFTNYCVDLGTPHMKGGGAVVPCSAEWLLDGKAMSIDCTGERSIAIRVNKGMGADAILGKAERKLHAKVLTRISGSHVEEAADDAIEGGTSIIRPTPPIQPCAAKAIIGDE